MKRQRPSLRSVSTMMVKQAQMQVMRRTEPATYRFTLTDGTHVVVTAPDLVIASKGLPTRKIQPWERNREDATVSMIQRIEVVG